MTVKELARVLERMPENATIVVEAHDHSYREVDPRLGKAWVQQNGRGPIEEADTRLGTPPGHDEIDVLVFA